MLNLYVLKTTRQEQTIEKKIVQQNDYFDFKLVKDNDIADKINLKSSDVTLFTSLYDVANNLQFTTQYDKIVVHCEDRKTGIDEIVPYFISLEKTVKNGGMILFYGISTENEKLIEKALSGENFWYFRNRFKNQQRDILIKIKK